MLYGTRSRHQRRQHPRSITLSAATLDALRAALPADLHELSDEQLRTATAHWLDDTLNHLHEHLVHYLTRQRLNRTAFDAACKHARSSVTHRLDH
ncbi:MAG: hypothetical protein AB4911_24450 [Oscillochloridaceae bacterium umkhey_bin13]